MPSELLWKLCPLWSVSVTTAVCGRREVQLCVLIFGVQPAMEEVSHPVKVYTHTHINTQREEKEQLNWDHVMYTVKLNAQVQKHYYEV